MTKRQPAGTPDDGLVSVRTGGDNDFEWRLPNGDWHRTDGPARQWDGGAAAGGDEEWFLNGRQHRVGGPAVQQRGGVAAGGDEQWFLNGRLHRVGGPAVQYGGGVAVGGREEHWLDGVQVVADQFEFLVACRGETCRVAAPAPQNPGRPQPSDGTARPGV